MLCNGQELMTEEVCSTLVEEDVMDKAVEQFGVGVNVVDEEAQFELDEDGVPEELVGFSVVRKRDHEVEVEYLDVDDHGFVVKVVDDGASVDQPYFTRSGDNPVLRSEAEQHDMKGSRLFSEFCAPRKSYYATTSRKWGSGKSQERNFHVVVGWIEKHRHNAYVLRKGWNRFWRRVYLQKSEGKPCSYMFPKQVTAVQQLFAKYGVTSAK